MSEAFFIQLSKNKTRLIRAFNGAQREYAKSCGKSPKWWGPTGEWQIIHDNLSIFSLSVFLAQMGPEKWCKQKWGMMTVSQGAFFSAEWKSGCVQQLMVAGMEGVGRSWSGRRGGRKEGRERECCGNTLSKYWTGSKTFFFFSVLALLRREMSHYNHTISLIGFCEAVFRCIQRLQKYIHAEYRRMESCIKNGNNATFLDTIVNFYKYLNPTILSSSNKDILKTNCSNNSK